MSAADLLRDQMIPGSLFDQLQEKDLDAAEARDAEVQVAQVADISTDGGAFNNGIEIKGDDITIDISTSPATFTGSGEVGCWPPIEVLSGVYAVRFTLNAGVVTTYTNASDGKVYAGAGAVKLDENGETLHAISVYGSNQKIKWITTDGVLTAADMVGAIDGTTPDRDAFFYLTCTAEPGGAGDAQITLRATGTDGTHNELLIGSGTQGFYAYSDKFGNFGVMHRGDYTAPVLVNSASKTTVYSRTIKAGSLGPNGIFRVRVPYEWLNASGGNRSITYTVDWGTESFTWTFGAVATSATIRATGQIDLWLCNANSVSSQRIQVETQLTSRIAADTLVARGGLMDDQLWHDGALDTDAANRTLTISMTLSSTGQGANYYAQTLGAIADGPYYGA